MSQVPPPGPYPLPPAPAPERRRSWFARHRVLTTLGAIVVVVVAIATATSGGGSDDPGAAPAGGSGGTTGGQDAAEQPAAEEPAAEQPAAEQPAEPQTAGLGTPVRDGKFEFTVTAVEPGVARLGDDLFGQDAQGQYVLVHLTVTNIGDEAQYFDGSSQKAFDAQGREFSADTAAAVHLGDANSFLNQINPGNTVSGTVVFDVPADAALTSLALHDSPFSGGVEVALG